MCNREYELYNHYLNTPADEQACIEDDTLLQEELQQEYESDKREEAREREWSDDDWWIDTRRAEADFRERNW